MMKYMSPLNEIRKNIHLLYILDASIPFTIIICTRCGNEVILTSEPDALTDYFYNLGWRGTRMHIYCPECAKTYNIK